MQVTLALQACHRRPAGKIMHRDVKPGNIFLDGDMNVKLGDFGLSKIMSDQSLYAYTHVGTPYYMSPEQINEGKYNEKSDIWSAGCLLYEMTTLYPPFKASNHKQLYARITEGKFERVPQKYSQELQFLIHCMLNVDYRKRPSVDDILALPHVGLRSKEKTLRDGLSSLKRREEELKLREGKAMLLKEKLVKREHEMAARELRRTGEQLKNKTRLDALLQEGLQRVLRDPLENCDLPRKGKNTPENQSSDTTERPRAQPKLPQRKPASVERVWTPQHRPRAERELQELRKRAVDNLNKYQTSPRTSKFVSPRTRAASSERAYRRDSPQLIQRVPPRPRIEYIARGPRVPPRAPLSRAHTFDNIWKYYGEEKQNYKSRESSPVAKQSRRAPVRRLN